MNDTSLEGLLKQYNSNSLKQIYTSMPGRVINVDLEEQIADIQPLIEKVLPNEQTQAIQPILSVPIIFPASKNSQLSFPVSVGDTVLLVFCQRDIDNFKLGSERTHRPNTFRKLSVNDAVAIPGLFSIPQGRNNPSKRTLPHSVEDMSVTNNIGTSSENEVRMKSDGSVEINLASNAPVTINIGGNQVFQITSSGITSTVPITAPDVLTESGVSLLNHTHNQAKDSGNDSEEPTLAPNPS